MRAALATDDTASIDAALTQSSQRFPVSRRMTRPLLAAVSAVVLCTGCATVRDHTSPYFGRAPANESSCHVEVVRAVNANEVEQLATRVVDGSVFLTPFDAERILSDEACAIGADVVLISSESYGVPFVGSQAVGTLFKRLVTNRT